MIGNPFDLARRLRSWGSENPSYDALMLLGPVVVLTVVIAGRNWITTAMAVGYVAAFVVAIVRSAVGSDPAT